jgi:hypothetical protein
MRQPVAPQGAAVRFGPANNPSLGLMEDKAVDARKSVFAGGFRACVQAVPVDAHSAPCYPINAFKSSFRFRVSPAQSVRPLGRAMCSRMGLSGTGFAAGTALWRRGRDDRMGKGGSGGCSE